jgi:endonuclease/exonuclease/phosphatase family metal-dependent hydrolase
MGPVHRILTILVASLLPLFAMADGGSACAANLRPASTDYAVELVPKSMTDKWTRFYESVEKAKGFKVMWWNAADGSLDRKSLSSNLLMLADSQAKPDLIALGEYSDQTLSKETIAELRKQYPHYFFLPYSSGHPDHGIAIFSANPVSIGRSQLLDWVPSSLGPTEKDAYRTRWSSGMEGMEDAFYGRTARELLVQTPNGTVTLVPVHLAQPWRAIRTASPGAVGLAKTVQEMFLGRENPLMVQISNLIRWNAAGKQERRVLIGDFNMPRGILSFPTAGFQELKRAFRFNDLGPESSFPTPSSPLFKSYPPVQIDHAFSSPDMRSSLGGILPIRGSDHFPVYSVFP